MVMGDEGPGSIRTVMLAGGQAVNVVPGGGGNITGGTGAKGTMSACNKIIIELSLAANAIGNDPGANCLINGITYTADHDDDSQSADGGIVAEVAMNGGLYRWVIEFLEPIISFNFVVPYTMGATNAGNCDLNVLVYGVKA